MASIQSIVNGSRSRKNGQATPREGARNAGKLADVEQLTMHGLDEWRVAYQRLMAGYAYALGEAARVGRARAGESTEETKRRLATNGARSDLGAFYAPLVRLLVGAHVRQRLDFLVARCSQLEAALAPASNARRRAWLAQIREEAEKAASGLPSLRLPGLLASIPIAATLVTIITRAAGTSHVIHGRADRCH